MGYHYNVTVQSQSSSRSLSSYMYAYSCENDHKQNNSSTNVFSSNEESWYPTIMQTEPGSTWLSGRPHQIIVVVTGFVSWAGVVTERLIKFLAVAILRSSGQVGLVYFIFTTRIRAWTPVKYVRVLETKKFRYSNN